MPRFVVLRHETPPGYERASHFDLMLEHGGALRTWALERLPAPGTTVLADRLPDHRLAYLDYEGAVSGNRGHVTRVDHGEFEILEDTVTTIVIAVHGQLLSGRLQLVCDGTAPHRWRVSLGND